MTENDNQTTETIIFDGKADEKSVQTSVFGTSILNMVIIVTCLVPLSWESCLIMVLSLSPIVVLCTSFEVSYRGDILKILFEIPVQSYIL